MIFPLRNIISISLLRISSAKFALTTQKERLIGTIYGPRATDIPYISSAGRRRPMGKEIIPALCALVETNCITYYINITYAGIVPWNRCREISKKTAWHRLEERSLNALESGPMSRDRNRANIVSG
jgi:hypothetical protein